MNAVTDIHGTRPTYLHFMVERLGANYVVVNRRTAQPKFDRRGFLQKQVTHGEYKAAERDYRAVYGDPYDDVRAEMYRALKAADEVFITSTAGGIMPVTRIDGAPVADGKVGAITGRLMAHYWEKHDDPAWSSAVRYP